MFENVLVGVDGGPGGRDAVALAQRLVGEGATLTLGNVRSGHLHPLHAATPALLAAELAASEELLAQAREQGEVKADVLSIVANTPGSGLHRQAEHQGADLIVVGSSRRGVIGRAMLGNDTRAALNGAPCAIAIASRGYAEHPLPLAQIGVAYNGSPESAAALAKARELAAANRAEVYALEVVSIPTYAFTGLVPAAFGETVNTMMREAEARMDGLEGVRARAVYGLAGEELALFSQELDLLVVGSRSYGPIKRLVAGSTSDYLERHARSSLLVLPRSVTVGSDAGAAAAGARSRDAT
jgi:nucleotide-binding universal stress UspA family protein